MTYVARKRGPMSRTNSLETSEPLAVRQRGGYLTVSDLSLIELSGKDAESFLHGRSSNDVKSLKVGQGQLSSLLDRKGYLIAFMTVHRLAEERFWILSDRQQSKVILEQFNTYHFREKIEYKEIADNYEAVVLMGPASQALIAANCEPKIGEEEYSIAQCRIFGSTEVVLIRRSLSGDNGFIILVTNEAREGFNSAFSKQCSEQSIKEISANTLEVLRIEAGIPRFSLDISADELLPETGLEQYAASYNKGCFQGQEVLARIKTYGAPRRALVGLIFEDKPAEPLPLNSIYSIAGEESVCIKSNTYSPSLQKHIALAYIVRDYRVPDRKVLLEKGGQKFNATVKFLPFYTASSSKNKAAALYKSALQEFASGSEEKSITMLREVIELDPLLADAYESLGVILSRHEQYDEAVALMHRLQALIPDSVMAHTNLSIYYMHLGDKDRAEEEKAIAMSIRMSQLANEHVKKKQEEAEKQKNSEEQEKRLGMFEQVLKIDPNDFLANNGVGTVYVELGRFEESIPYLKKAIAVKPTHTVAYLALGKAYESLERIDDAINVYKTGIDVAAKRGDITPMKEMQGLLHALENKE